MGLPRYVQLRSRHPLQCDEAQVEAALLAMPSGARGLARTKVVSVVPADHPSIEEEYAAQVRAASRPGGIPSVTIGRDDGTVTVALGQVSDMAHEMVHVAQVYASEEARARSFAMVVRDGRRLAEAVALAVSKGADRKQFSDVDWCADAMRGDARDGVDSGPGAHAGTWGLHREVHPKAATASVGEGLGLDRRSTMAATYAMALADSGSTDFGTEVAREVVAYRYQGNPEALEFLFDDALTRAKGLASPSVGLGRLTFEGALEGVAAMPESTDVSVPAWVARDDVDKVLLPLPRGAVHSPYVMALRSVMPAVVQPVDEVVSDGRAAERHMGVFLLYETFGTEASRRLWFDRKALAYRLVHLGLDGPGVLDDLRLGSLERRADAAYRLGLESILGPFS